VAKSGWISTPPLNAAIGWLRLNGSISMAIPRGGRPLVMLNSIPACRRCETALAARSVSTFSCVTSVPSTSAIPMRIGGAASSFFDAMLKSFPGLSRPRGFGLLLLVVPQQTAVDEKRGPCHVVGLFRSQKTGQTSNVFRCPEPPERDVPEQVLELDWIIQQLCVDGRFDRARSNRVNRDFARSELNCQVSCQHLESSFACAIGRKVGERQFFVHRTDIDDLSRAPRLAKVAHYCLRHKEHAFQVDVQNGVEVVFRYIPEIRALFQTRVVHEDVDLAEGRRNLIDEFLAVGNLSDIRLKGGATPVRSVDFAHNFIRPFFVFPIADRDIGPFLAHPLRDRAPNSLIASGYRGYFACQSI